MQARLQPQGRQHARPWHRVSLPTRVVVRAQAATEAAEKSQLRAVVEVTGGLHRTVPLNGDRPTVSAPATSSGRTPGGAGDNALPGTWADPLQLVRSFFLPRGWPHSVTPGELSGGRAGWLQGRGRRLSKVAWHSSCVAAPLHAHLTLQRGPEGAALRLAATHCCRPASACPGVIGRPLDLTSACLLQTIWNTSSGPSQHTSLAGCPTPWPPPPCSK